MTTYYADIAIPYFKNNKMKVYLNAMTQFSTEEVENAQRHSETWTDFIQVIRRVRLTLVIVCCKLKPIIYSYQGE